MAKESPFGYRIYIWPIRNDGAIQTAPALIKGCIDSVKMINGKQIIAFQLMDGPRVLALYMEGPGAEECEKEYREFCKFFDKGKPGPFLLRPYAVGVEDREGNFSFLRTCTVF